MGSGPVGSYSPCTARWVGKSDHLNCLADMKQPRIDVMLAQHPAEFEAAKALILEYVTWLGIDLSFQNFDAEMAQLPAMYGEPAGGLLLARVNGTDAGVAGIRPFQDRACELKRMFVRAEFRNLGLGQRLLSATISLAKRLGYETIRLDTADFMQAAIRLYVANGFVEIPPYRYNPHEKAMYFELKINPLSG